MKRVLGAVLASLALMLGLAGTASADVDDTTSLIKKAPIVTWDEAGKEDCSVTVKFKNRTKWEFSGDVRVDGEDGTPDEWTGQNISGGKHDGKPFGERYQVVALPADEVTSHTVTFEPYSGEHEVAYRVWRGPENDWYVDWKRATVDCGSPTEVTPEAPTVTDPICTDKYVIEPGSLTIPDVPGVNYLVNGEAIDAGTHEMAPGTYEVTAEPFDQSYAFPDDVTAMWQLTIADEPDCEEPDPGEVTATVVSEVCELVEIRFDNTTDEPATIYVKVDGEDVEPGTADPAGSITFSRTFEPGTGEHVVEYRIGDDGEWMSVTVDCGEDTGDEDGNDESGDEDGSDESGSEDGNDESGNEDGSDESGSDENGDESGTDDGTSDEDGADESGTEDGDADLPDTGANVAMLTGIGALALGGGLYALLWRRRNTTSLN